MRFSTYISRGKGSAIKGLVFVFCVTTVSMNAQQEWGYTQYVFNLYDINAAYAGNHNSGSFGLRHRSQWIGFEGAPVTQALSFHAPLCNEKLGAGIKLLNESIGARNRQVVKASVAFKLALGESKLSFGFAGGMQRQGINRSKLTAAEQEDAQFVNLPSSVATPVIDASIFFNSKTVYFGIESNNINRGKFIKRENSFSRLYYNVSLVGGYLKKIRENSMLQFSALLKFSEPAELQVDGNILYLINNKYWLGAGYRWEYGPHAMAAINFTEHFRLGLSFDIATNQMRASNDGSAEIFLGYNLKNRSGKSIRYF